MLFYCALELSIFGLQMMTRNEPHVLLDVSHEPPEAVRHHFPNIAARCLDNGIDITQKPIPVVPTQHYCCGGVQTNMLAETDIRGLYACGEVAHTGMSLQRSRFVPSC